MYVQRHREAIWEIAGMRDRRRSAARLARTRIGSTLQGRWKTRPRSSTLTGKYSWLKRINKRQQSLDRNNTKEWDCADLQQCKEALIEFADNYERLAKEVLLMLERNSNIQVENWVVELWNQNLELNFLRTAAEKIDSVIQKGQNDVKMLEKLLENLSVMILSKQKDHNIDPESCELVQSLFGDKVLMKVLKHLDSGTSLKRTIKKTAINKKNLWNKSMLKLRKLMMELELSVGSRDQFLLDEGEIESTQNMFIKALSIVDKIISTTNENSTNKSNSEWDTKSVSWDKTTFDVESKIVIKPQFSNNRKVDLDREGNVDLLNSVSKKRSISAEDKSLVFNPDSLTNFSQQRAFHKQVCVSSVKREHKSESWKFVSKGFDNEDFVKIVHMQAAHLENLILYIEDMNEEFDKLRKC